MSRSALRSINLWLNGPLQAYRYIAWFKPLYAPDMLLWDHDQPDGQTG